jgi:hypothetical protein
MEQMEDFSSLIDGTENVDTIGYHVSKAVFDQFDDNRLGGNTQGGYGTDHTLYSVDSLLGHQFVDNPQRLLTYPKIGMLGGYMYKVNLRLGRTADINLQKLMAFFPKTDPRSVERVKQFRAWLLQQGFGGVRITGGKEGKLMNNTVVALSAKFVRIRSVKNMKTGTELQAKNGPFQTQIAAQRQVA